MSNIRVTYSGFIAFLTGIVGVVTGIIFIIIVVRRLSPEDLGLWTLIGSLVSYVVIVEPIISYWTTRQIARGEQTGKTALVSSGFLSSGAVGAYFIISILLSSTLKTNFSIIALASFLIPLTFLYNTTNSIALGHKPHTSSYASLCFELAKLPLGFLLVYVGHMGIAGAIIATIGASLVKLIVLLIMVKPLILGNIKRQMIKFWFRLSWIPLYGDIGGLIFTLDVLVFLLITNSLVGLAYWGIAMAMSNLVMNSGYISQGLFPKIISTGKKEHAEKNLRNMLFLAMPILASSIVFAKPALHIMNPLYENGVVIVYFLSFRSLVNILRSFFWSILSAYETVDLNKDASPKHYIKSKLFLIPTLINIQSICYVGSLAIVLILLKSLKLSDVYLVTIWSIILLVISIPFMIHGILAVKREHKFVFPIKSILKFSLISLFVSIVIYLVLPHYLSYDQNMYYFIGQVIILAGFGGIMYFGLCYIFDKESKNLLTGIFGKIRK